MPTEVVKLDKLFVKIQEAHEMYLRPLDDDGEIQLAQEWYNGRDKVFVSYWSKVLSGWSIEVARSSTFSKLSAKLKSIEAKAKAAVLEVKAKFLKDKQALRMTSVELKLLQQIVEAKAEEKSYEQFDEEQILDCINFMYERCNS